MNIQEREEMDYEATAFRCEFQAAYAVSQIRTPRINDTSQINACIQAGLHVAVEESTVYCDMTDAILGSNILLIGAAKTREKALSFIGGEESGDCDHCQFVRSPQPHAPQEVRRERPLDDDIPF